MASSRRVAKRRTLCQSRKSGGSFLNASDRPACQTITDRGIAMIPLPRMGPDIGSADEQTKRVGSQGELDCKYCKFG